MTSTACPPGKDGVTLEALGPGSSRRGGNGQQYQEFGSDAVAPRRVEVWRRGCAVDAVRQPCMGDTVEINMLAWYGHGEPDIVGEFEAANNVKFKPKYYAGGDNMLGLIAQSPPGTYDIILSDGEFVQQLNAAGYIEELNAADYNFDDMLHEDFKKFPGHWAGRQAAFGHGALRPSWRVLQQERRDRRRGDELQVLLEAGAEGQGRPLRLAPAVARHDEPDQRQWRRPLGPRRRQVEGGAGNHHEPAPAGRRFLRLWRHLQLAEERRDAGDVRHRRLDHRRAGERRRTGRLGGARRKAASSGPRATASARARRRPRS
jgi:hypothetical protein